MAEYLTDVLFVLFFGVGVDEDVIQVYQHASIGEVTKDVIHEVLEGGGHVHKSKRHDTPFKGAIAGAESGLPFITLSDSDQMVHIPEVDFQIDFGLVQAVKEVRDLG